jgi:magnesium transporter
MLINCVAYQNGKKLGDIPVEDISDYVTRPECFVWVALFEPSVAEIDEMAAEFELHPLAVEDAKSGHQRPKIEEYDDSLFVVLHTLEPVAEGIDTELIGGEVDIFVGKNYILSVRHRAKKGFGNVRARCEREPELLKYGAGFVLYALMDYRRRPLLSRSSTAWSPSSSRSRSRSSCATRRARTSRRSTH